MVNFSMGSGKNGAEVEKAALVVLDDSDIWNRSYIVFAVRLLLDEGECTVGDEAFGRTGGKL